MDDVDDVGGDVGLVFVAEDGDEDDDDDDDDSPFMEGCDDDEEDDIIGYLHDDVVR